jgi:hypothetical protein
MPTSDQITAAVARMEAIGKRGLTISICCGPSDSQIYRWSVDLLSPNGQMFDRPFAAKSFVQCIEIAEAEIAKRRWGHHADV